VGPIKVPESLDDEQVLFLSDVLPTGYMAAENCNIQPGDTVAVWGCGPVGLFSIASARLLGADRVIAIDRFPERLRKARQAGAETLNYESTDILTEGPEPDGLGAALTAERASAVNAAVAKLPERYRVPLALVYYADADYSEIASQLGLTRTHVGVLLCRAKQLLRRSLADVGLDARVGGREALAEGSP
jgi:threonine dehydrogenase-like Zn-dependent dehydrogenase